MPPVSIAKTTSDYLADLEPFALVTLTNPDLMAASAFSVTQLALCEAIQCRFVQLGQLVKLSDAFFGSCLVRQAFPPFACASNDASL